jgi:hypothetical protein
LWNGINGFYLGIIGIILEATRNNCPKNLVTLPGSLREGEMSNHSLSFLSAVSRRFTVALRDFGRLQLVHAAGQIKNKK